MSASSGAPADAARPGAAAAAAAPVALIAAWEFRRWYKVREQVLAIAIAVGSALLVWLVGRLVADDREPRTLAVLGAEESAPRTVGRFTLEPSSLARDELLAAPEAEGRDGVLEWVGPDRALLHRAKPPRWLAELREGLAEERLERRLDELALDDGQRARLFAPIEIEVRAAQEARSRPHRWTALAVVLLAALGVFVGMTYQFVAITGEKQARVTELVLSAVSPQTWIDGKILGLSLLSGASTLTYALSALAFVGTMRLCGKEVPLALGFAASPDLLWVALAALGGFLFWNTLFAAVAATINDPYSSARGSLLMLPGLSLLFAFLALIDPGATWVRVLAVLPPTAWSILPLRLVLDTVPAWEIALALALLLASLLFLRRAAGRIFEAAILLNGKEPSWREMAAWALAGRGRA